MRYQSEILSGYFKKVEMKTLIITLLLGAIFVTVNTSSVFAKDTQSISSQFNHVLKAEGVEQARLLLVHEINDGNLTAVHLLAGLLIKGKVFQKNIALAVEVLEKGVEFEDPKSSYILGKYYSDGQFVVPNVSLARQYYELAVLYGHDKAEVELAKLPQAKVPVQRLPKKQQPETDGGAAAPNEPKKDQLTLPLGYSTQPAKWKSDTIDLNLVKSTGSGFAISENGLIATNEHVIDGCRKIFAIYQGKPKIGRIIAQSKKEDFALISIDSQTPSYFYLKSNAPELGEELISGGFPSPSNFGFGIKITTGIVSDETSEFGELFQHSTPSQPGNSGGPLINKSGSVVGISTAVSTVKWGELAAQNVNYAVSNNTSKQLIRSWGLQFKSIKDYSIFDTKTLAEFLKKAAVQILCY